MTRHIGEPSSMRTAADHRSKIESLARRPPLGGNAISIFRALHYNDAVGDDISVGSSATDITYNFWENGDTAVFTPLTSAGGTPTLGTHNVQRVRLLATGLYVISWGVYFDTAFQGTIVQYIHDNDPIFGRPDRLNHAGDTEGATTVNTSGYFTQTIERVYPLLDPFGSGSHTVEISTDSAQNSGAAKTVTEAWLEIHYRPNVSIP